MSLLRVTIVIHAPEDTEGIDRDIVDALDEGFRGTGFVLEQLEQTHELERAFEVTFSQTYKLTAYSQAEAIEEARGSLIASVSKDIQSTNGAFDVAIVGGEYVEGIVRGYEPDGTPVVEVLA